MSKLSQTLMEIKEAAVIPVCLLRELQWVANVTQPDIAYAINKLTTYTTNPSLQHVGILKCILCYLAGTKNLGITYYENPDHNQLSTLSLFHGYTDVAYANSDDLKSISGTCVFNFRGSNYVEIKEANNMCLIINRSRICCII